MKKTIMQIPAVKPVVLLLVSVGLSGCGVFFGDSGIFRDRSNDYLKSDSVPPLKVPPELDQERFGQLYVVPQVNSADWEYPDKFMVPRPQPLSANVFSEMVKIQKLGERSWIAVNTPPAELWPRVRSFLSNNALPVAKTNPQEGVIETTWLSFKDDPNNRDKYQIRVEQGVQPDSAEIHIVHAQIPRSEDIPADFVWPKSSQNKEREMWMVDELSATLANEVNTASASLLAQTIGGGDKVLIAAKDKEPVLRMELEFNRAWATLSFALRQEGFTLLDESGQSNIFYANYRSLEDSEGFFSRWFGDDEVENKYSLQDIISHLNLEDTPQNRALFPADAFVDTKQLPDVTGYLFLVTQGEGGVEVYLRDAYGNSLPSREARDLLDIVRRNLI